jgi:zinc protease
MRIIYLIAVVFVFAQCSKKTMDKTTTQTAKNTEAFRSKAPAPAPARPIDLGAYGSFDLPNGLKVIVVENHKLPKVSYQISLSNDPVLEGEQGGYVQFAGDLLTKGTSNRPKAKLDEEIDFIGATLNSSPSGLFGTSLKKHSGKLLELMTDVLYNPTFPEEEFQKMKSQSISALASSKTDANSIASNVSAVVTYGKNHPYGEVQTEKTVNSITLDKCKEYYNTYFKPNNAYLVIVGDITVQEARMQAEKHFASWKSGTVPMSKYDTPASPNEPKVVFANKDGAVQSVINVTYPVVLKTGDADEIAANVMNNILGGGIFSGRLMQNLREKRAYTYGARSSLNSDKLVGNFKAFASVRNAVTDSSVQEFIYEMDRMVKEPVSENDLQLAKNSMAGSFARSLESPQTIAGFALNTYKYNLPKDYYNTYLSRLEKVNIADIQRVAAKYVKPQNAYILVVGNKDEVAEKLLRFDGDKKIDYYDAYGEVLNYDNLSLPPGLTGVNVVEDYLDAIGGMAKLQAIKSMASEASMSLMGQEAKIVTKHKMPDKFLFSMQMNGMVMQEQKTNGQKAQTSQMGQAKVSMPGEPEFEEMKGKAQMFDQLEYLSKGFKIDLKGVEEVEGQKCYKLSVTDDKGELTTQFYNISNSLLVRISAVAGEGEKAKTVNTDFKDYREVSGILMPHEITLTGQAPFPLVMKYGKFEFNGEINDTDFDIK